MHSFIKFIKQRSKERESGLRFLGSFFGSKLYLFLFLTDTILANDTLKFLNTDKSIFGAVKGRNHSLELFLG